MPPAGVWRIPSESGGTVRPGWTEFCTVVFCVVCGALVRCISPPVTACAPSPPGAFPASCEPPEAGAEGIPAMPGRGRAVSLACPDAPEISAMPDTGIAPPGCGLAVLRSGAFPAGSGREPVSPPGTGWALEAAAIPAMPGCGIGPFCRPVPAPETPAVPAVPGSDALAGAPFPVARTVSDVEEVCEPCVPEGVPIWYPLAAPELTATESVGCVVVWKPAGTVPKSK